jgi:S1-C subfamily serine protease
MTKVLKFLGVLVLSLAVLLFVAYTIQTLETLKQDIHIRQHANLELMQEEITNILNEVNKGFDTVNETIKLLSQTDKLLIECLVALNNKTEQIPSRIKRNQRVLEVKLQNINVQIVNDTREAFGSGVSLKYKNKYYILTAGHMMENATDRIYLYENHHRVCELEVVKISYEPTLDATAMHDLLLMRPKDETLIPRFYAELADIEAIKGTEVYVVGNPLQFEDVISEGRIIAYKNNFLYFINHSYFGNSGGGIYTKDGQLLGIISHLIPLQSRPDVPPYVIHGATRLQVIRDFLQGI